MLENTDDSPYKYEVYDILRFFFDNYKEENGYILEYINRCFPQMEETNALQDPMEEEIDEPEISLDEKRRRVMNKRRKNGLATHAYLLMRVTLYPLHYLIVPHAY